MSNFFKTWTIANVESLGITVDIHPSFDYDESIQSQRPTYETETGKVKQFKLGGGSFNFSLPLDFIDSSDNYYILEWWRDQKTIRFAQTASGDTQTLDCRITNTVNPLNQFARAQYEEFDGLLNLVSTDDQNTNRGLARNTLQASYFILGTSDGIMGINALG